MRRARGSILAAVLAVGACSGAAAQNRPGNTIGSAVPPKNLALIGVTQVGDISRAWLVNLDTNRRETVATGGQAFGYRVKRVQGDSVVLTRSGRDFVLRLGDRDVPVRETAAPPRQTVVTPELDDRPVIRGGTLALPPVEPETVPEPPVDGRVNTQPGQQRVEPQPVPPEPMEPYYPGYAYVPGYGYVPDPGYPPGYAPYNPYSPYGPYGGYPGGAVYPDGTPAYTPYGYPAPGLYPGGLGYTSPGFYPGRVISPVAPRWNPQTNRRRTGDYGYGSSNPQTQRRRSGRGVYR